MNAPRRGRQDVDPRSPVPKYLQLRELLLDLIAELAPDSPVPSERELGLEYGMSRMTAREAVDLLVSEGRLYRVPGKGTFVAQRKVPLPVRLSSFSSDIESRGMRPGSRMLGRRTAGAGAVVGRLLDISPDTPVHVVERLRLADDVPMAIERSYIPAALAPGLLDCDLENSSLYQTLERRFGIELDGGEEFIEAAPTGVADAELLGVSPGSPLLMLERIATSHGRPVEYSLSRYRGDRYQLRVSLNAQAPGGVSGRLRIAAQQAAE